MSEKPILFKGPLVRAILDGRKTVTRRIVKPQPKYEIGRWIEATNDKGFWMPELDEDAPPGYGIRCPYGVPGDRLWARETFCPRYFDSGPAFRADWTEESGDYVDEPKWKPAIHMPRYLSRLTLEVVSVRVERLQEIDDADAGAEGMSSDHRLDWTRREQFQDTWDTINGKCAPWASNPVVWRIEFRKIANAIRSAEEAARRAGAEGMRVEDGGS